MVFQGRMLLCRVFLIATLCTLVQTATAASTPKHPLNGWYTCSDFTFSDTPGRKTRQHSECATYSAPLCYPGICKTPATADATVDIFVKRMPATVGNVAIASNAWVIQGGPGKSSTAMEQMMLELHTRLEGKVNVYTMDHRGTGRSTLFDCVAAQAMTTGSPRGRELRSSEVPACAKDLHTKYGSDFSSFSTTSAASDILSFISDYSNGASTIVYGVSYGTAVVERLMHLNPPTVKGYVLDGIAASSGAAPDKFEYFSMLESDYGEVGEYFMGLCTEDAECSAHFQSANLSAAVQDLIANVDNDPSDTCASLVADGVTSVPPSWMLRNALGKLLQDMSIRALIPAVVYRLNRCDPNDVDILTHFFKYLDNYTTFTSQDDAYQSTLLYYLVVFSELWEIPVPTSAEVEACFTGASIASGDIYGLSPLYCVFSKEKSVGCTEQNLTNDEADGIIYQRDQYWNKTAIVPNEASALLLSGRANPQTPHKYAEYLLEALDSHNKELITFDYAAHGTVWTTPLGDSNDIGLTCGMKLLVSYINNIGDLQRLDRSCVYQMPAFNMTVTTSYLHDFLATEEAYDGVYHSSLSWFS